MHHNLGSLIRSSKVEGWGVRVGGLAAIILAAGGAVGLAIFLVVAGVLLVNTMG